MITRCSIRTWFQVSSASPSPTMPANRPEANGLSSNGAPVGTGVAAHPLPDDRSADESTAVAGSNSASGARMWAMLGMLW